MHAKAIAVANQKGGVGKTTTALSLGAAMAMRGERVLIVDLDPHVCASVHLRFYPDDCVYTIFDIFQTEIAQHADLWPRVIQRHEEQTCDIAPGDVRLSELEGDPARAPPQRLYPA